jgi:hypothetical protein
MSLLSWCGVPAGWRLFLNEKKKGQQRRQTLEEDAGLLHVGTNGGRKSSLGEMEQDKTIL